MNKKVFLEEKSKLERDLIDVNNKLNIIKKKGRRRNQKKGQCKK